MILPRHPQTTIAVASHYDELDAFYREIWGEHVHHGYWPTGRETPEQAVVALITLLAGRLALAPGQVVCDIGCGYGATARHLAATYAVNVNGVTVSTAQARRAQATATTTAMGRVCIQQQDWLANRFAQDQFDRSYAIESSEHMPDKQVFFNEAFRTLKPDGLFAVCVWLACDNPRPWQARHLLEPICREGRLPGMGNEADYRDFAEQAGFGTVSVDDLTDRVRQTWTICTRRALRALATQPRYRRFLLDRNAANRIFAITLPRIMLAYRTGAMRYCLMLFRKPAVPG